MSIYTKVWKPDGSFGLRVSPHPGQQQVLDSQKRFIAMIAGTQGGKTSFGSLWLFREIEQMKWGDYMVVTPSFGLLEKKALPEFLTLFRDYLRLGHFIKGQKIFEFTEEAERRLFGHTHKEVNQAPTRVMFGYAANPDSLESATAKAVWMDEAGQSLFKLQSWEALQRRLSIHQGRALITTTPYNLGWLKRKIYDPWIQSGKNHPDIDVVQFRSDMNPSFPEEEMERARRDMPLWKFKMFYEGQFARPEGLIYNMFSEHHCIVEPFEIPSNWGIYVGMDFGAVNMYAVFYAMHPDNKDLYLYDTYSAERTKPIQEHADDIIASLQDRMFIKAVGGAPSETQWRTEYKKAGLFVQQPEIGDVEVGIDRVIKFHHSNRIKIFSDQQEYLTEKLSYRRKLDDEYRPTEEIENKSSFHIMDSERYIISSVKSDAYTGSDLEDMIETNAQDSKF